MRLTIFHVKLLHTLIFAVLSACVAYIVISASIDRITTWTWVAIVAIVIEGMVLAVSGGRCPLTAVAERLGASDGSVADIFLPRWFADRIFPICGTLYLIGCAIVAIRVMSK